MNSDELTALITDPHLVISTPPPPPICRGRSWGRGDDRKPIVYKLTRPPRQPIFTKAGSTWRGGGGPRRGRPDAWGRRRPTVHRVKNIVQRERQPCSEGHRKDLCGALGLVSTWELGCRNWGMNVYCKETSDLENSWTREVMELSNGWGPATQLLGEAIQIADGGTLPRVLFMLCLLSVIICTVVHKLNMVHYTHETNLHQYG